MFTFNHERATEHSAGNTAIWWPSAPMTPRRNSGGAAPGREKSWGLGEQSLRAGLRWAGVSSLFPPRCDHREGAVPLPRYDVGTRPGPGILPQPQARWQVKGMEWCLQRFPRFLFAPQWDRLFQKTLTFLVSSSFKGKIKLNTYRTECQRFFLKQSLRCRVKYFQKCAGQRHSYIGAKSI